MKPIDRRVLLARATRQALVWIDQHPAREIVEQIASANEDTPQGRAFRVRDMINTTWAGRMP